MLANATHADWVSRDRSLLIEHLERQDDLLSSNDTALAYIFCDYKDRLDQTQTALLSSILGQLLRRTNCKTLSAEIMSLYEQHKRQNLGPSVVQLQQVLAQALVSYRKVFFIVDALDECSESDESALQLISTLRALGDRAKILCTSRFSTTFEAYFQSCERLEISASADDIRTYLQAHLHLHPRLSRHVRADPSLETEIVTAITDECRGM